MSEPQDDWDYEHQRAETLWTVSEILAQGALKPGTRITLDLQFLPGPDADADAFLRKLGMFGYSAEMVQEAEVPYVEAQVESVALAADAIWTHEERTTKLALIHGFVPDGWGFLEP